MADNRRLLELALKGLEAERRKIDQEIAEIAGRLRSRARGVHAAAKPVRRGMSAARRKAVSRAMKAWWAQKKAEKKKQPQVK
ncbi:MAG: hypothetical protein HYX74_11735 [Acidobacteria bacterium]|nr:hypothetical protein [Acidobacteriota bacterium]